MCHRFEKGQEPLQHIASEDMIVNLIRVLGSANSRLAKHDAEIKHMKNLITSLIREIREFETIYCQEIAERSYLKY